MLSVGKKRGQEKQKEKQSWEMPHVLAWILEDWETKALKASSLHDNDPRKYWYRVGEVDGKGEGANDGVLPSKSPPRATSV